MECATKAGLCRRLSRRANMIARKNPVKAPRNASVIERLLNGRSPWPVRMNPVYAIATVQRITRTENMGHHLLMSKYCHISPLWREGFLRSTEKDSDFDISHSGLLNPSSVIAIYRQPRIGPRGNLIDHNQPGLMRFQGASLVRFAQRQARQSFTHSPLLFNSCP